MEDNVVELPSSDMVLFNAGNELIRDTLVALLFEAHKEGLDLDKKIRTYSQEIPEGGLGDFPVESDLEYVERVTTCRELNNFYRKIKGEGFSGEDYSPEEEKRRGRFLQDAWKSPYRV